MRRSLPAQRAAGKEAWLGKLLELAARHADRGKEVFRAPVARVEARGDKHAVSETRFLWVDIDHPRQLNALWAFLAERPCHLLVASGGSGGAHAYWKLAQPLQASHVDEATGEVSEPIERANLRLVHALGVGADGKPNVADPACAERSRVMRLAGTVNAKTGQYARIIEADFALPPYPLERLVGDFPDPATPVARKAGREGKSRDPYKRISPPEYFEKPGSSLSRRRGAGLGWGQSHALSSTRYFGNCGTGTAGAEVASGRRSVSSLIAVSLLSVRGFTRHRRRDARVVRRPAI